MSEQFINVDDEAFEDAPRQLRDAYKKLVKDNQRLAEERDTFKGRAETSALGDVLKGFVKPERVKSALRADGIDPLDQEAVKSWVEENGDDFARASGESTPSTPNPQEAEEAAAHERLAATGSLTQPADMSRWESAQADIPENATAAQVRAHLVSKGF